MSWESITGPLETFLDFVVILLKIVVAVFGFLAYQAALKRPTRIFVLSLPVILALDNLFAGSIFSGAVLTTNIAPFIAAIFSTSFALVGFALSAPLGSRLSRSAAVGLAAILLCLTPILF